MAFKRMFEVKGLTLKPKNHKRSISDGGHGQRWENGINHVVLTTLCRGNHDLVDLSFIHDVYRDCSMSIQRVFICIISFIYKKSLQLGINVSCGRDSLQLKKTRQKKKGMRAFQNISSRAFQV